ncbi:heat-inducible transcription repressor hrca c-terminal [Lucifera butyrica]|uniref:Heat-inducible transcription repressor HrcA n=1 Tax=Lucifera butyrica TaxID=1351585 RepID=A0A498R3V7_9FIRM|nr:heat-inducible transcription repressor hrca c-terminal [Lucifera butyrica]
MDERKKRILQAIIDDYISTAEPVGSRTIARKYDLGVGAATIRNEMADLELLGYLEQPHTSAGRIPSARGYRFYVDALMAPYQISDNDMTLIKNWYQSKVRNIEEVFQETAKMLSRMTRNISLVLAPQVSQCTTFKYMQFLPLDETRAIIVVVTDTGFVENKIINIPAGTSLKDLQKIANGINNHLSGLTFDRIKSSVFREIRRDIIPDRMMFDATMEILKQTLGEKNEKLYMGGTSQLLSQPEFQDVDKIKEILTVLEEERLMCDILHMQDSEGVVVTIGQENKYSGIRECSVVQAMYRVDGKIVGKVAILGPTRMEYGKIMAVLEFMHSQLEEILQKFKL